MSDVPNGRAIAKCFYVDQDDRYTVNQRIGILRATRAEPRFLFYSINRNPYFLAFDDGIKQTNLRKDEVLSCPVLLPPLEEQRKIAAILSTWDEAIGQQTRLIELKRERKRGLMQQLLTGKVRFKEFEGLAWQKVSLGDVLSESRLPGVDKLGKRLTVALHLKGVSARDERGTSEVGKTIYYTRRKDQIIYGKQNLHKGALGIVPKELDGYLSSQDIPAFDVADGFLTAYVCYFLARRSFYEGLEAISTGTGSKRIHPEALFQLRFHFPQYEEQQKIASVLSAADTELETLQTQLIALRTQKRGLMQQLLTGKTRVKLDDPVTAQ